MCNPILQASLSLLKNFQWSFFCNQASLRLLKNFAKWSSCKQASLSWLLKDFAIILRSASLSYKLLKKFVKNLQYSSCKLHWAKFGWNFLWRIWSIHLVSFTELNFVEEFDEVQFGRGDWMWEGEEVLEKVVMMAREICWIGTWDCTDLASVQELWPRGSW